MDLTASSRHLNSLLVGTFYINCKIENHASRQESAQVRKLLVDTGSEYSWIYESTLSSIGVSVEKKDVPFRMANGQLITREVGFVIFRYDKFFTIDEVVFAKKGDLQLLGARTLEGLNLLVDTQKKKLVVAGPSVVASIYRCR